MQLSLTAPTNAYTVSELTARLKATLADDPILGGSLTVQGELSNVKQSSRGHLYFTLKDSGASLSGVMWASRLAKLRFEPEEGMEVFATGQLDIYAPSGSYSLICVKLEPVGIGALQLAFQQLKARLEAEGLFDAEHKRPLPSFPSRVGIVTARTGAVIHDMMRIIRQKNPLVDVVLAPTKVQGEGAAASIARGINVLQQPDLAIDVIIVARGGGSFEDLFCFSEETVVRAVHQCRLPLVTGLGHEPDFSLADAAADVTVATPTAAADVAVPDTYKLLEQLEGAGHHLAQQLEQQVILAEQTVEQAQQGLSYQVERVLEAQEQKLSRVAEGLAQQVGERVQASEYGLSQAAETLEAYSPLKILRRGYSLTATESGQPVHSVKGLSAGERLTIRVQDGMITSEVRSVRPLDG